MLRTPRIVFNRARVSMLATALVACLAFSLSAASPDMASVPLASHLATQDATAAAPAVVLAGGFVVTRLGPFAYRACARYCYIVPHAWNVYDAVGKVQYIYCTLRGRSNCPL
jgi:hypothetical protein